MKPMKTKLIILFVALVVSLSNVAQVDYLLDPNVKVYQSRGTNFITLALENNELFIKEYDNSGQEIWADSFVIGLDSSVTTTTYAGLFKGTSDFIIVHQQSVTSSIFMDTDTNALYIIKLNLDNYSFDTPLIDTLGGGYYLFSPMTDTTFNIYAYSRNDDGWAEPTYYETWSLNREMELIMKAPRDSITEDTFTADIYEVRDTLYFLKSSSGYTWGKKYTQDISFIENFANTVSPTPQMTSQSIVRYREPINDDTIFVFTNNYYSQGDDVYWLFDLLDFNLNSYNRIMLTAPQLTTTQDAPLTPSHVNYVNGKIYILASYSSSHEGQAVYVYDLEINELCVLPMSTLGISSESSNNHMVKLNNKMYIARDNGSDYVMSEIDCEKLVSLNNIEKNNILISPNPSSGFINISTSENESLELTIVDATGKIIHPTESFIEDEFTLDLNHLTPGIYFFYINTQNITHVHRQIVID